MRFKNSFESMELHFDFPTVLDGPPPQCQLENQNGVPLIRNYLKLVSRAFYAMEQIGSEVASKTFLIDS